MPKFAGAKVYVFETAVGLEGAIRCNLDFLIALLLFFVFLRSKNSIGHIMNKLTIKNIGPLKSVFVDFAKYNLFIGPQSSGKSCILKIASFCNWIEKRIELSQSSDDYLNKVVFWERLVDYHRLNGFIKKGFLIKYESSYMFFSISGSPENIQFSFKWKPRNRWQYRRPQIAYIPAERNIVAVIPNWFDISFSNDNNIQGYLSDWENARNNFSQQNKLGILNLGLSYYYDNKQHRESIYIDKNTEISFLNASSGLQSVVPLCGLVNYLTFHELHRPRKLSVAQERELNHLQDVLYEERFTQSKGATIVGRVDDITNTYPEPRIKTFGSFKDESQFSEIVDNYSLTQYASFYLEEPEENLFPATQYELVKWIAKQINTTKENSLCIATHSPYILSSFNNLIQAADNPKVAESIVGESTAIPFEDINVYAVDKGTAKDIKDYDLRLISQTELDTVSDTISSDFSKLLEP